MYLNLLRLYSYLFILIVPVPVVRIFVTFTGNLRHQLKTLSLGRGSLFIFSRRFQQRPRFLRGKCGITLNTSPGKWKKREKGIRHGFSLETACKIDRLQHGGEQARERNNFPANCSVEKLPAASCCAFFIVRFHATEITCQSISVFYHVSAILLRVRA